MALSRAAISAASDLKTETVKTPAWRDPETGEDTVEITELTAHQRQRYGEMFIALRAESGGQVTRLPPHYHAVVCAMGLTDPETGERMFDHENAGDIAELSGKGQTIVDLSNAILRLSGLDAESEAAAEKK